MTEKTAVKKTAKASTGDAVKTTAVKAKAVKAKTVTAKAAAKPAAKPAAKNSVGKKPAAKTSVTDSILESVVKSAVKSAVEGSTKKAAPPKKVADRAAAKPAIAKPSKSKPSPKAAEKKSAVVKADASESVKVRKSPKKAAQKQKPQAAEPTPVASATPEPLKESVKGAAFSFTTVQEPPEHLTLRVEANRVVAFHYRLCEVRQDGSYSPWIESSFGRQPLFYLHGHGNVVPGLEQAMAGKKAGDMLSITLQPEQAYGFRTSNELARLPIKHLHNAPPAKSLVPGVIVGVRTQQGVRNALVVKVGRFNVDVDTNHPFAGRTLHYQIEVLGVRHASAEEVAHRHVHGPGGHQH